MAKESMKAREVKPLRIQALAVFITAALSPDVQRVT